MTLGQDWPLEEVQDALETYGLRILGRERHRVQPEAQKKGRGRRHETDDMSGTWTQTHYTIRRDLVCEACQEPFGYLFEVDQVSRVQEAIRGTDGALRRELSQQIRRRIRCPRCRTFQKEPRRTLLRQDRWVVFQGCGIAGGGMLLTGGLALLGGWLAHLLGFVAGAGLGLAFLLVLWVAVLPRIFAKAPPV